MSQLALLVTVHLACVAAQHINTVFKFQKEDPDTGEKLICDRCPPGQYLRAPCTATQKSDCVQCPPDSFTEQWNHIDECLRCGVCGFQQVVKTECSPQRDCRCECKGGYYYEKEFGMCIKHTDCGTGHGVVSQGTPEKDTVCQVCPTGFYSAEVSALHSCTAHSPCEKSAEQRLVLNGSTWHDSICASCHDIRNSDGAKYLREIAPSFFIHQNMPVKRLRRFVLKNQPQGSEKPLREKVLRLQRRDLNAMIEDWVLHATSEQIRLLPKKLRRIGAHGAADKLENKLERIDSQMTQVCLDEVVSTTVDTLME